MDTDEIYVSHLPTFYKTFLLENSTIIGLPADQLNLLIILIINALSGCIYRRLNDVIKRHLFGMSIGILSICTLYGIKDSFGLFMFILLMYPIATKIRQPNTTFWISQSLLWITFAYIAWFYYLSFRMDFTASLMGITVRLHTLTWDLHDADLIRNNKKFTKDENGVNIQNNENIFGKFQKSNQYRTKHACYRNISLFEYMSFMFFFVHILCGSNITINDFLNISDKSIYHKNGWKNKKFNPHPSWKNIISGILQIIIVASLFLFPLQILPSKQELYNLPESYSLMYKIILISLCGWFSLFKYHFCWKSLDLVTLTSGAAFSGVEYYEKYPMKVKIIHWNRAKNINSFALMHPQYTGDTVRNWNMTINHWLTFYIFNRVIPPKWMNNIFGNKFSKILITRIVAAMFHGVYLGYYLFFISTFFVTLAVDTLRVSLPTCNKIQYDTLNIHGLICHLSWSIILLFSTSIHYQWMYNMDVVQVIKLMHSIYWFPVLFTFILWFFGKILIILQRKIGPDAKLRITTQHHLKEM